MLKRWLCQVLHLIVVLVQDIAPTVEYGGIKVEGSASLAGASWRLKVLFLAALSPPS